MQTIARTETDLHRTAERFASELARRSPKPERIRVDLYAELLADELRLAASGHELVARHPWLVDVWTAAVAVRMARKRAA